jgi:hypothetical protein
MRLEKWPVGSVFLRQSWRWVAGAVLGFALGAGMSGRAEATTVTYSSTCADSFFGSCSSIGLAGGDAVSGTFVLQTSAVVANAALTAADLLGFSMTFGTVTLTMAQADAIAFEATLNATANGFTDITFAASDVLTPDEGDGFRIRPTSWAATPTGGCDVGCGALILGTDGLLVSSSFTPGFGAATFSFAADEVPTPEPAGLALLATGLAGLAAAGRRGRRALA